MLERTARWVVVAALGAVLGAALLNVFGQRDENLIAVGDGATLELSAPRALRSGLFFQGRVVIAAHRDLRRPTLVLHRGWLDAISVNTILPEPAKTASEAHGVALVFSPVRAGRTMTVFIEFQVNPTTFGRRDQGLELRDGDERVAAIERTVTIFP